MKVEETIAHVCELAQIGLELNQVERELNHLNELQKRVDLEFDLMESRLGLSQTTNNKGVTSWNTQY